MGINTTKLKFTSPDGVITIKPWASKYFDNRKHLGDARKVYKSKLDEGFKIDLFH